MKNTVNTYKKVTIKVSNTHQFANELLSLNLIQINRNLDLSGISGISRSPKTFTTINKKTGEYSYYLSIYLTEDSLCKLKKYLNS